MDSTKAISAVLGCTLFALVMPARAATVTFDNPHPEIQMWSYPAGSANGAGAVRDRAPTFAAFSYLDEQTSQPVFYQGDGLDPSRRGSFLVVSDTSSDIPTGLPPSRYRIDGLKVTTTLLGNLISEPAGRVLPYDNTLDDAESLTTAGDSDTGHPIEMYGLGLQGDYESISFTQLPYMDPANGQQIGDAFQLGDVRWRQFQEGEDGYNPELPPSEQAFAPYQFYAIDADGRDVENSVNGGYSATEVTGHTNRFTPAPLAIGKVYDTQGSELAPGTLNDTGDKFVFEPNLSDPRIVAYVQRSLSEGHLGFSFSSMHEPLGHTGTIAYPDFYIDDWDVGNNPDGDAPRIELLVTVLDPLTGDYDGSGAVDQLDFLVWQSQYGGPGPDADGNEDGVVDAIDYAVWRENLGASLDAISQTHTAPEPSGAIMVFMAGLTFSFCGWVEWFVRPQRRGGE